MSITDRLHALDRLQQRTRALAFVAAVIKKFGDDEASRLAALIAYYGFVSLFPLLLVLVTVLGFVLEGDQRPRPACCTPRSASSRSSAISCSTTSIRCKAARAHWRSAWSGLLLGGLGIVGATQNAFQQVWHIRASAGPTSWRGGCAGLGLLVVLGVLLVVSTASRAT